MNPTVSLSKRLKILQRVPAFAILPHNAQLDLANNLVEEIFGPKKNIVEEGAKADRLYLIVSGQAEVLAKGRDGDALIGQLRPGEIFGEIALLAADAKRTASIKSTEALLTLSLSATHFGLLLKSYPELKAIFETSANFLHIATFLKQGSPFSTLTPKAIHVLAKRLKKISLPKSALVIRQGEEGNTCYLICQGEVEVIIDNKGKSERVLTTLGVGSIFGEAALLTNSPRNATVQTTKPCELLEISRADFLNALGQSRDIQGRMMELLSLRSRPHHINGVIVNHRSTSDNFNITILHNPKHHTYFQLSPEGWFIWQKLDGHRTLRDITLAYLSEFKSFAPHTIAETIGRLSAAGFLINQRISIDVQKMIVRGSWWKRTITTIYNVAQYRIMWTNVDAIFSTLYKCGGRLLYTKPVQVLMAMIALSGALIFIGGSLDFQYSTSKVPSHPLFFLLLATAFLFTMLAHELSHALTTKAFGRKVLGIGVGWYWLGPVAFVDTSDMWLAPRWPRVAVAIAGLYTNIILGGLASLIALVIPHFSVGLGCWYFTLGSYLIVLVNLNPLLEYDGYHALADILDRPNLRARFLSWLKRDRKLSGHTLELLYGIGVLFYTFIMAIVIVVLCQAILANP